MKKWETLNKIKYQISKIKTKNIIKILLENRGIKTEKEKTEFFNPRLDKVTTKSVGIDKKQLNKAINRINEAVKNKEQIVVYGDYDVDGVCSSAIIWETLNNLGAKIMPYIPHRIEEGYGLSIKGISNLIHSTRSINSGQSSSGQISNTKLIITVDNGIVANDAVDFANKQGIDVIISDHHTLPEKLPKAYAIIHTAKLCGAGIAYLLAQEIKNSEDARLELVALATIADVMSLLGINRTLTKYGLEALRKTKRIGLLELCREAMINPLEINTYEVGHIIAPRLNAMGRLEYAMDSLRLICAKNKEKAQSLARILNQTNRERQNLTEKTVIHAKSQIADLGSQKLKLLFISHESYQQGVIGLVAGKLVEQFYRPAIVVSKGEKYCKASARSISGFNMIEFIRSASEFLIDAGGHPMAAGFTVETSKLSLLQKKLEEAANKIINEEDLTRTLKIDCELPLNIINEDFYLRIQKFEPFGIGNPEPVFISRNAIIEDVRLVGRDGKHIKLRIGDKDSRLHFDAIAFGIGERVREFHIGGKVDIVYTIYQNNWPVRRSFSEGGNGNKRLQLKIKDLVKIN